MRFYIIAAIIFFSFNGRGQGLVNANKWKFSTGDDASWSSPGFDDSKWKEYNIGENWESWGNQYYNGFAWYRKSIVIPSALKKMAVKNGGFILNLQRIDDVDFTYFNGKLIGNTGTLEPDYQSKWDVIREYVIPFDLINWDKANSIAVRVFDSAGGGGIVGKNLSLNIRGFENKLTIKPVFKVTDHVLKGLTEYQLPFEIENKSDISLNGKLKVIIVRDFLDTFDIKDIDVKIGAKQIAAPKVKLTGLKPCVYIVQAFLTTEVVNTASYFNFLVDPEKMISPPDNNPDFFDYWARAKRELALVDPQFNLIKKEQFSTPARDCYLVEMRSLGNVLIRGWYFVPKKAGKYPAVLTVQGYSTNMLPEWAYPADDMVSLAINIRGHGNSTDNFNPGFPGYLYNQIEDKEKFVYKGAYMDCVRATDFLFSRPDVDTNRVGVEGGSQGGALSFATAALCNNRIKAVVPQIPFLSDFKNYIKVAKWPANEWFKYAADHPEFGIKGELNTLSYIDIKNLAPLVTAPVYMQVGLLDVACPPRINFAAYNNLNVPKKYIIYPFVGHGTPAEFFKIKDKFIRETLQFKGINKLK
jgi:cephalosporin-C deacetylase